MDSMSGGEAVMTNVAVLGLGWWGSKILRNVVQHPGTGKVVGADPLLLRRKEIKNNQDVIVVDHHDNVFDDPEIDAVVIATPPATHFDLIRKAFETGKDVLVTKPPTKTIEELESLVALAGRYERVFMMDSTFVYCEPVRRIKELLDDGLFDDIRFVQSLRYGNDLRMHHVNRLRDTMIANEVDVIEDLLFHDMAILNYLLQWESLKTTAVHRSYTFSEEFCDTAFIRIDTGNFPIHIGLSWTLPERRRELVIADAEQQLIFDDLKPENKITLFEIEERKERLIEHGNREPLFLVIDHFLNCVKNRSTPFTDGAYMLNVMKSFLSVVGFS